MKVLLACGGTGGHINPAIAIANIIKTQYPTAQFLFVGAQKGLETKLVPAAGFQIETFNVAGFQRKLTVKNIGRNFKAAAYLATSGHRVTEIIKNFQPDIAIGTGGYAAGPVIRKAAKMGIPCAIHEQNAFPGVTNILLSKVVKHVMLTTEEALKHMDKSKFEYTVTGLPVRAGISRITKAQAREKLGFDNKVCILSFGGSLGAGCINSTMADVIKWHTSEDLKINHIHGYGGMGRDSFPKAMQEAGIPLKSDRLRITEYIDDMDVCLAAADLVVCRAGATTLAELQAVGRASILIPSPIVAENHQFHNANVLKNAGAAVVFEQKDVTSEKIISCIKPLCEKPDKLSLMSQNAAKMAVSDTDQRVLSVVEKLLK